MEKRIWELKSFGKNFGTITLMKDAHQKEFGLTIEIEPSPGLEIRTSSCSSDGAQFTFKEK